MSDDTDDIDLLMGVLDSAMDPNPVSVEPEPPTVLQEEVFTLGDGLDPVSVEKDAETKQ